MPAEIGDRIEPKSDEDRIVDWVRENGPIVNSACQQLLGVDAARAYYLLMKLCDAGRLKEVGSGKGRKYRLN